jgi:uncharacterized repeat protein (TIGR01451 family)
VTPVTSAPSPLSVPAAPTPALSVAKSVTSTGPYNAVGQSITYQFLATNTGNVTVSGVAVSDTQSAPAGALAAGPSCVSLATPSGPCAGASTTLAPGQVATFTASYTITQADLDKGSVADSATVTGDPPGCASPLCAVTSAPSPVTTPTASNPGLSVVKSSSTPTYAAVGGSIAYDFLVTNTGNVTVAGISVTDTQSAPATQANLSAVTCPAPSLAPLATETCSATYTVTQADLDHGSVADSATASGIPTGSVTPVTSAPSPLSVPAAPTPALSVAKSVTPDSIAAVGQTLTDTFVVSNIGNVPLSGVGVTDTQNAPAGSLTTPPECLSLASPSATCSGSTATLAPGQVATFTATYTVSQADLDNGSVHDSSTASGIAPGSSTPVTSGSSGGSATTPATAMPGLTLRKSASASSVAAVGQIVTYTFTTANTGNVSLTSVGVSDTQNAPAGALTTGPSCVSLSTPTGACSGATTTLLPGQVATFTGTYVIAVADLNHGTVDDSATASGTPSNATMPITSNVSTVDLPAHVAAAPSPLAFTGFDVLAVVGAAGSLILVGLGLVLLAARRRNPMST